MRNAVSVAINSFPILLQFAPGDATLGGLNGGGVKKPRLTRLYSLYKMIRVEQSPSDSSPESDVRHSEHEPMLYCPVCSLRLTERKCKLFCERCGYFMSCADYY